MPSNGGNYPGVDPDGRAPGGLEIAGNVSAGSFSRADSDTALSLLAPATVIGQSSGLTIPNGNGPNLTFDTVVKDYTASADLASGGVTVDTSGLYLISLLGLQAVFDMAATNYLDITPNCIGSGGQHLFANWQIFPSAEGLELALTMLVYFTVPSVDTMVFNTDNHTGHDVLLAEYELAVTRLA